MGGNFEPVGVWGVIADMKSAFLSLMVCVVVVLGVVGACAWLPASSAGAVNSLPAESELLASNTVLARFSGVQEQPCRFMTALCPHRCDHATRLASFEVLENLSYSKPGKYGDEMLSPGSFAVVDVQKPVLGQPADIAQRISRLRPGDVVKLTICHYYVKQGQGQFPVRPAVLLELVPGA